MVGGATYRSLYANHELSLVRIESNRDIRELTQPGGRATIRATARIEASCVSNGIRAASASAT
jgi:hypothetical protein